MTDNEQMEYMQKEMKRFDGWVIAYGFDCDMGRCFVLYMDDDKLTRHFFLKRLEIGLFMRFMLNNYPHPGCSTSFDLYADPRRFE